MDLIPVIYRLGVALAIGLLIGLQREYAYSQEKEDEEAELFAGTRTFALFTILGFMGALATDRLESPFGLITVLAAVVSLIVISYLISARNGNLGLTTEAAAVVTLLIGSVCYWDELVLAAAIGVLTAILLSIKVRTRSLAENLTREDIYATLKFAFISIIVLPLLPREGIGPAPFDVVTPFNVWLMVVFISGISFLGYALIKIVGIRRGMGLAGLLGGLASSTAVTVSFSQQSKKLEGIAHPFALAIMASWAVMIVRVAIEILTINRDLLNVIWLPLLVIVVSCAAFIGYLYRAQPSTQQESPERFTNPFELRPALIFGLLYAVILVLTNAAQLYFGDAGIYISSVLSGLVDVDAITLSMARLSQAGGNLETVTAARAILFAVVSNTVVKGGFVMVAGSANLRRVILPGLILILGAALISAFVLINAG